MKEIIFDRGELLSRSLDDLAICRYVATVFIENAPEYLAAIRNAMAAEDAVSLHRSAHKLKGAAATMALPLLVEITSLIETLAETEDLEKATILSPLLSQRFEQAIAALQELFIAPEGISPNN